MSHGPMLFPYLDVAMRAIAVLILCVLPVLLVAPLAPRGAARTDKTFRPTD
jgi:hypothetical protein